MRSKRYVEITSGEASILYNHDYEILEVKHFKGGIETTIFNKKKDGKKNFVTDDTIDYMIREDIFNSLYGID